MWNVEEVFDKEGTAMPVPLTGYSAEELIEKFDEPGKLMVIHDPFGGELLCHKRDRQHFRKRVEIARQLFRERGIQKGQIWKIGLQGALELREIVRQRMKEG